MSQLTDDDRIVGNKKRYLGTGSVWRVVSVPSKQTLEVECIEEAESATEGEVKTISKTVWKSGMYNPDQV